MDKILKIVFSKKTTSKNLPKALRLATKLGCVVEDDFVRIKLSAQETFNLWEWVNALFNLIDKWSSFEIYYRGRLAMFNKEYRSLFYAVQNIGQCYHNHLDPTDFDKCNSGWGCDYIRYISLGLKSPGIKKWYDFGHIEGKNTWVIDKSRLLNEVQIEIERKYLKICPAFPNSRIQKVIDQLPDSFILDEFWTVQYKNEMVEGVLTKVVDSIWYNSEFEKDWFSIEKMLNDIERKGTNPYSEGTDEWLDWMINKGYLKRKQ